MKLIVGLGNPGKRYKDTRHNVGFVVVDQLLEKLEMDGWKMSKNANALCSSIKFDDETIDLIKPQTFMNDSGISVAYARNKHKISNENLYVIHDDLDIKLGDYKIQRGKGPKDHNGLNSICEKLGTRDFWHVRVGVEDHRSRVTDHGSRISGEDYVLMKFTDEERAVFDQVLSNVVEDIMSRLVN